MRMESNETGATAPREEQEQLINAWIDGELAPEQALVAAKLAAADPRLEKLSKDLLELRRLPLASTFEHTMPAMPAALNDSLQSLLENAESSAGDKEIKQTPTANNWWNGNFARAAVVVAAIGAGYFVGKSPSTAIDSPLNNWSEAVFNYQSLYTRETVANSAVTIAEAEQLVTASKLGTALSNMGASDLDGIEALANNGYKFVRAQMLGYNNSKLLQVVYLAETGLPLAFCVMPLGGDDQAPNTLSNQQAAANAAYWQSGGFAYALVGELPEAELRAIADSMQLAS